MRVVPQQMTDAWRSGQFTGKNRPIARATIQLTHIVTDAPQGLEHLRQQTLNYGDQRYSSYIFGNPNNVYELPNVKSVQWQRSVETDVSSATIVLYNVRQLPIGVAPGPDEPFNQPGYFTFNRGDELNRWNHTTNQWTHLLYPDQIIRTYEGYGYDSTVGPEADAHMMPSGVWLIDDVQLSADATITLQCRDAGRILLDEIAFPPVVPSGVYPLHFDVHTTVPSPKIPVVSSSGGSGWINPTYRDDSGTPYNGRNGSINGHRASDAFDGSDSTYWLSIGNSSPNAPYSFEWIEGTIPKSTVAAVRTYTKGGPYRMYVSLYDGTQNKWLGRTTIPYDPHNPASAPNGANIPYVQSSVVKSDSDVTVDVADMPNITRVRVTFTSLWDSNYGTYQYRAAIRDFDVLVTTSTSTTTWVSGGTHLEGNYDDYTDIVKRLLGYGGFLWPKNPAISYQKEVKHDPANPWAQETSDKFNRPPTGSHLDPIIGIGAIWGDLEQSGTFGPAGLDANIFDKKPLMDGIAYIRDMLGFNFYIDETGGAIFRSPNIWAKGNWVVSPGHRYATDTTRTASMVEVDERQTLMGLQAHLSSRNVRERVVVANLGGNVGAVTKGFLPYKQPDTGLRRVSIWSDQHFLTSRECQIMADLIALRQLFTYRTDQITIPGYPAIQVDDQIRIIEAVTEENNDSHYVKGISSTLDMSTGEWIYTVDTHWLGTEPFSSWAFDPANLAPDTQQYLADLGKIL